MLPQGHGGSSLACALRSAITGESGPPAAAELGITYARGTGVRRCLIVDLRCWIGHESLRPMIAQWRE
jgi:hypothetical protein